MQSCLLCLSQICLSLLFCGVVLLWLTQLSFEHKLRFIVMVSIVAQVISDVYLLIFFIRKLLYTDGVCQSGCMTGSGLRRL